jgi:hypothetical protein
MPVGCTCRGFAAAGGALISIVAAWSALAQGAPGGTGNAKQIGTLTCTASAPSADPQIPAGKETQFACTFEPIGAEGVKEYYVGSSTERLRDIGPTVKTIVSWSVHSEGKAASPGSLEGTYKPAAGEAGSKNLTGGAGASYVLRPLTTPDQSGGVPMALDSLVLRRDRPRV